MNKQRFIKLITETIIQNLNEMPRIATLVKLSTTDPAQLDQMIPAEYRRNSGVKNIIDFFLGNNNTPASIVSVAKHYGYPAQQSLNTQFQNLIKMGVIEKGDLATPKRVVGPKTARITHQTGVFGNYSDKEKIGYIIKKMKTYQNIPDMYKKWFTDKFGEENFQKLADLVDSLKNIVTKVEDAEAKQKIRDFIISLGFQSTKRGRKPVDRTLNTQPPSAEDEADVEFDPNSLSDDEEIGL